MTREEQQKYHWERNNRLMRVDPDKYFYNIKSGLFIPFGFVPGIDLLTLHYGMFAYAIQSLGSEE
jgi:hypothetical protein